MGAMLVKEPSSITTQLGERVNRESMTTLVAQRKDIEPDDNTVVKSLDDPKAKCATESNPVKTSLEGVPSKP